MFFFTGLETFEKKVESNETIVNAAVKVDDLIAGGSESAGRLSVTETRVAALWGSEQVGMWSGIIFNKLQVILN